MKVTVINLDKVISQIEQRRKDLPNKINKFMERLSTLGAYRARVEFTNAMYAGNNDVEVRVDKEGSTYKVVASGSAVLFIEFGTGKLNPEHPQAKDVQVVVPHGTYGSGKGSNPEGWVYVGEQGNAGQPVRDGVYRTHGNPPAKAMYSAAKDMKAEITRIAKEVFG